MYNRLGLNSIDRNKAAMALLKETLEHAKKGKIFEGVIDWESLCSFKMLEINYLIGYNEEKIFCLKIQEDEFTQSYICLLKAGEVFMGHEHPFPEVIDTISGEITDKLTGETKKQGERMIIPPNTPHIPWNSGEVDNWIKVTFPSPYKTKEEHDKNQTYFED